MTDVGPTRIDPVIELLTSLAAGDLSVRGDRSETDEDLDAVMVGINMLAEELVADRAELEDRVVSRTVELELARAEALEGSRLKSEFLATMSHEIRTPMNGVIGLTNLLLQTPLSDVQRQYAEGVQQAGEALLMVINDILDFSKLEAGMVDLEVIDFDPRELVESVASLLALTASHKGLELIAYCRPDLPARVIGDEGRLRQIVLNLASNAVKFTDHGEVVISASAVSDDGGRERMRIQVTDSGIGIPDAALSRLFDSFSQADASTTRRFGGTGLGLAICRRLTEAMGGQIGVNSQEGVGSTFWFEVPLLVAPVDSTTVTRRDQDHDVLHGARVLVVDDNATNRLVLESQLASWGMRPDVSPSGRSAIPLIRQAAATRDPYVIAVLDMCMPEMDGLELARLISADPALADTRLIVLSSTIGADQEELARAGVHSWLTKPVRGSELFDRLTRMIAPPAVVAAAATAPATGVVVDGTRGRVLVVEDNSLNQLVAEGVVSALGYRVDLVANGLEALEAIAFTDYSAVLMDCHMPVMDGFTAAERIRLDEGPGERLPIIAMTAGARSEDRERCFAAGMDAFVSKPVDVSALKEALDAWARSDEPAAPEPAEEPAEQPSTAGLVIDPQRLDDLRRIGPPDGLGLLPAVTQAFSRDFSTGLVALRRAFDLRDSSDVSELAHQLKGAAANLGALRVTRLCARLEASASETSSWDTGVLDQLDVEFARAHEFLRAELTRRPPP